MKIEGEFLRGYTDAIILSIIEKKDNYGYQINSEINQISNELIFFTEATLYTSFKRLEKEGFIISYWQEGINTKRKFYSITIEGKEYSKKFKELWKINMKTINIFLGDEKDEK